VLESLGAGRPVCAIELPQLASVIKSGISGELVARSDSQDDMAARLADAFARTAQRLRSREITPEGVAGAVAEFTPERQLANVYERHRRLQRKRFGTAGADLSSAAPANGVSSLR
jgi:hypothetical protein